MSVSVRLSPWGLQLMFSKGSVSARISFYRIALNHDLNQFSQHDASDVSSSPIIHVKALLLKTGVGLPFCEHGSNLGLFWSERSLTMTSTVL